MNDDLAKAVEMGYQTALRDAEEALTVVSKPRGLDALRRAARIDAVQNDLCAAWLDTDDEGSGWVCVRGYGHTGEHNGDIA